MLCRKCLSSFYTSTTTAQQKRKKKRKSYFLFFHTCVSFSVLVCLVPSFYLVCQQSRRQVKRRDKLVPLICSVHIILFDGTGSCSACSQHVGGIRTGELNANESLGKQVG